MTDHYATLGVKTAASLDEIRRAFRKLAAKFHPDRNPGNKEAELKFKGISKAYDVLSNQKSREAYDRQRAAPPPPTTFGFTEPDFVRAARARNAARRGQVPPAPPAPPAFSPSGPMELGKTYKTAPPVKLGPMPIGDVPVWMAMAPGWRKKS
jgi:curved DNA-binding protein CbpA